MAIQPSATGGRPERPYGLGEQGRELWDSIALRYELRPDELRMLADAAREVDIISRLEADLQDAPLMVKGSMGQLTASPLVSELRMHRTTLTQLLKALKLPDSPAEGERKRAMVSDGARKAARARWGSGAGAAG